MELRSYYGSSSGERASERQRRLAVNQFGRKPMRRFESCRSRRSDPGSANGRPPRSERGYPGSSPGPGTSPIGDRLMAGRQALTLLVEVRILVPEQIRRATKALSDNRIDDDARGRAPPRPQRRPCSRSGDGAWLKSRRCWFDSRRGHRKILGHVSIFTASPSSGPIEDGYRQTRGRTLACPA